MEGTPILRQFYDSSADLASVLNSEVKNVKDAERHKTDCR